MTTSIRIGDWTKQQLAQIRDEEDHSSHDSVIKSLLKERDTAEVARLLSANDVDTEDSWRPPADKRYDALTVMAEAGPLDDGEASLWCPGCGDEVMYLHMADFRAIDNVQVDCQQCDVELSAHSLVYLAEPEWLDTHPTPDERQPELKEAVIDHWERSLEQADLYEDDGHQTLGSVLGETYAQVATRLDWEWRPCDVPVLGIGKWVPQVDVPKVYRNTRDEEFLVFVNWYEYDGDGWSDTQVVRWPVDGEPEEAEVDRLPGEELEALMEQREFFRTFPGPDETVPEAAWEIKS